MGFYPNVVRCRTVTTESFDDNSEGFASCLYFISHYFSKSWQTVAVIKLTTKLVFVGMHLCLYSRGLSGAHVLLIVCCFRIRVGKHFGQFLTATRSERFPSLNTYFSRKPALGHQFHFGATWQILLQFWSCVWLHLGFYLVTFLFPCWLLQD